MQATISRQRETLADVSACQMTRYPPGLISALEKLRDDTTVTHSASTATAHLWIEQPMAGVGDGGRLGQGAQMFDTHPPLEERIALAEGAVMTTHHRAPRSSCRWPALIATLHWLVAACGGGDDDAADHDHAPTRHRRRRTTTDAGRPTTQRRRTRPRPTHVDHRRRPPPPFPADPVMPLTGLPITDDGTGRPRRRWSSRSTTTRRPARRAGSTTPTSCSRRTSRSSPGSPRCSRARTPTRSARSARAAPRTSMLLGSLNQPLFAWSGGNANVTRAIRDSDLVDAQPDSRPATRAGSSATTHEQVDREHTLYASTPRCSTTFTPPSTRRRRRSSSPTATTARRSTARRPRAST